MASSNSRNFGMFSYIHDFLQVVKVCQSEVAYKNIDSATTFKKKDFNDYHENLKQTYALLLMKLRDLHGKSSMSHLYLDFETSRIPTML